MSKSLRTLEQHRTELVARCAGLREELAVAARHPTWAFGGGVLRAVQAAKQRPAMAVAAVVLVALAVRRSSRLLHGAQVLLAAFQTVAPLLQSWRGRNVKHGAPPKGTHSTP